MPKIYDINTDTFRLATQEDIDKLCNIVSEMAKQSTPIQSPPHKEDLSFRLAIYPNKICPDSVFVAEEKPIEPYKGITGMHGEPLYPSVPTTPYTCRGQLPTAFAHELVKRWNEYKGNN